jgi:hypothetical protein
MADDHTGQLRRATLLRHVSLVEWINSGSAPIDCYLPIHDVSHVSAFDKELHRPFAFTRHSSPPGSRIGILFEAAYLSPVELEIYLTQFALRCPNNRVSLGAEHDGFGGSLVRNHVLPFRASHLRPVRSEHPHKQKVPQEGSHISPESQKNRMLSMPLENRDGDCAKNKNDPDRD